MYRNIAFLSFYLILSHSVSSQISIFVDNTYQHEILGDSLSGKKTIVNQKTYDLKGTKLYFEINYDYETTLEKNIVAYFYDSLDRMTSKEIQTVDRLPVKLFQIKYDKNGDTLTIKLYTPADDTVALSKIKNFHYDPQKRLKEVKVVDSQERLLERHVFSFSKESMTPTSKTVYRYDPGSCRQKYTYSYTDTAGLLKKIRISDKCSDAAYKKYSIVYEYNPKNKIAAEITKTKGGKVVRKRVYQYNNDIDLSTFYDVNDKNKIAAFYSRTFFWHKVSYLNVKSYFE